MPIQPLEESVLWMGTVAPIDLTFQDGVVPLAKLFAQLIARSSV